MSLLSGHLGNRTSALLDGQLPADEAERAWAHVQQCHACRDRVEREGWIKRRVAGLSYDAGTCASDRLKGSLLGASELTPGELYLEVEHHRRNVALAAVGGTALGAAVMGVLALGAAPASAPTTGRPMPVASVAAAGTTVAVAHREPRPAP
ncbi:anti-sigma factor [Nocardioides sp. AN3]